MQSYFAGGLVLLVVGFGFSTAAWLVYVNGEGSLLLALFGLLGVALFVLGTYISVRGAAKIDR